MSTEGTFGTIVLIIVGFLIYFIPYYVGRKTKYASGIFVLNLLLGWTILGWIGALIWAVSAPKLPADGDGEPITIGDTFRYFLSFITGPPQVKSVAEESSNFESQNTDPEIARLRTQLKDEEAIIRDNTLGTYTIVTASQWEKVVKENKQDQYDIIESK